MVVDRLLIKPEIEKRLEASVNTATKLADGLVMVAIVNGEERLYSQKLACPDCGASVPQLEPRCFSFNSPFGACETCSGLGSKWSFDPAKIIVDPSRPLLEGGLGPGGSSSYMATPSTRLPRNTKSRSSVHFAELPQKSQTILLEGAGGLKGVLGDPRILHPRSKRERLVSRMVHAIHVAVHVSGCAMAAGSSPPAWRCA